MSATDRVGAGGLLGGMTRSGSPVSGRGCGSRIGSCGSGTGRGIGCCRRRRTSSESCFCGYGVLFALSVDMVFYDLTSTYVEGAGPAGLAKHGHSRDGKPRNRQVLVGVVMIDGWPIAHHVFEGNQRDAMTVEAVLDDLHARFGLRRVSSSAIGAW
jgi:hypothetical protein